jgi:4-alpha-glucanotransferase
MDFPSLQRYYTGVVAPVSALRTVHGAGTGEFYDLIPLAEWCKACGIDLIQLLPVQDTGFQSSPYSALSAFALHPLYLSLSRLPEAGPFSDEIARFAEEHRGGKSLSYEPVLRGKLELLSRMYDSQKSSILSDPVLRAWIDENPWVRTYAVFHTLKERNGYASWRDWEELRDPSPGEIEEFWHDETNHEELMFHVWLQFRLDEQFRAVSRRIDELGILLKGDLPILMNDDSADVWSHRDFFDLSLQAGAPPDYYSTTGQNWGFPVYNWSELEKAGYSWWKDRLRHAARYFHAFRIDHVLGFFRIWSISAADNTGYLGHFDPAKYLTREELRAAGFDDGRIRWLSIPHVPMHRIRESLGDETDTAISYCFDRIGNEDLFNFKPGILGEKTIMALPLRDSSKEALAGFYRDRTLVEVRPDLYFPIWTYRDTAAYRSLFENERLALDSLADRARKASEWIWEENGRKLLGFMKETTTMLPCAEDLGAVPESVPVVLEALEILSLKIPRWVRDRTKPEEPLIPITEYPFLSVCAPSVHDTSTLGEWWTAEPGREELWRMLGYKSACPETYGTDTARKVIHGLLKTSSCICVFPIQELFALDGSLKEPDPRDERINVPGTIHPRNWSYRITPTLESVLGNESLIELLRGWTEERSGRKVKKVRITEVKA